MRLEVEHSYSLEVPDTTDLGAEVILRARVSKLMVETVDVSAYGGKRQVMDGERRATALVYDAEVV